MNPNPSPDGLSEAFGGDDRAGGFAEGGHPLSEGGSPLGDPG